MVFTRSIEVNARFSNDRPETLNTCGSGDIMFSVGRLCYRSILLETAVSRQENRQMLQTRRGGNVRVYRMVYSMAGGGT